jgi:hypothetical protein
MTTVADNDNTHDWAADCDGEGRERAVRDGGDSGVVMMAAAAADDDSATTAVDGNACKIGQWPLKKTDKSGRQETAETRSGDDGCRGGRWRPWTMTVADDNNSDGRRQQRQRRTTTAVNDDSGGGQRHARWAADYKGEGGERGANNNGIRARQAESVKKKRN